MKMKQKLIVLGMILGFSFGLVAVLPSDNALADCGTNPDGIGCNPSEPGTPAESDDDSGLAKCDDESENCCGDVATSIIGCPDDAGDGEDVIFWLLRWVLRIMTAGVGIAAVGGIAYGALLYTTAESKPEQTKKAIGVITNVVIGIIAYALMAVFLNFLIPGGVFS